MTIFEPRIISLSKFTSLALAPDPMAAKVVEPPGWQGEVQKSLPVSEPEERPLPKKNWAEIVTPRTRRLEQLRAELQTIRKQVGELRGDERDLKRFDVARVSRQIAKASLELITVLEERFATDKEARGELLALKGIYLHEEGAAYATEVIFSAVIRTRYQGERDAEPPSTDPLQLRSEVESLRYVLDHGEKATGIKLQTAEITVISKQLGDLERQVSGQQMVDAEYELGSIAFRKQLHNAEFQQVIDEALDLCSEVRSRGSFWGATAKMFTSAVGKQTLDQRVSVLSDQIRTLDDQVMKTWGELVTTAPNDKDLNQRSLQLITVSRLVEQRKAELLKQLFDEVRRLPRSKNPEEQAERDVLVGRMTQLLDDYRLAEAEFFAKEVAYRAVENRFSGNVRSELIADPEKRSIFNAPDRGMAYIEAFCELLVKETLPTGPLNRQERHSLRWEVTHLIKGCLEELQEEQKAAKEEISELQVQMQNTSTSPSNQWEDQVPQKEIAELQVSLEHHTKRLSEVGQAIRTLNLRLDRFETDRLLESAEGRYEKFDADFEKVVANADGVEENALHSVMELSEQLAGTIRTVEAQGARLGRPLEKNQLQRLEALKKHLTDLEKQVARLKEVEEETYPDRVKQRVLDQIEGKAVPSALAEDAGKNVKEARIALETLEEIRPTHHQAVQEAESRGLKIEKLQRLHALDSLRKIYQEQLIDATSEQEDARVIADQKAQLERLEADLAEQELLLKEWELEKPLRELEVRIGTADESEKDALELEREGMLRESFKRCLGGRDKEGRRIYQDRDGANVFGRLLVDPEHRLKVLAASLRTLEKDLQAQVEKLPEPKKQWFVKDLREILNQNGALIEAMRAQLMQLESEAPQDSNAATVGRCKDLLNTCAERQRQMFQQYQELYREERHLEEGNEPGLMSYLANFLSGERPENTVMTWSDSLWGPLLLRDADFAAKMNVLDNSLLDAEKKRNSLEKELSEISGELQAERSPEERNTMQSRQTAALKEHRIGLQNVRDLQVQKHAMTLERIIAVTTELAQRRKMVTQRLGRIQQSITDLEEDVEQSEGIALRNHSLKLVIEKQRLMKRRRELSTLEPSLTSLKKAFEHEMAAYTSYPNPQLTLKELLAKQAWDITKEAASLGYLKSVNRSPGEFRLDWEAASLGFEWKNGLQDFSETNTDLVPLLESLVGQFLKFAQDHPSAAEALVADIAVTMSLIGDESLVNTLTQGVHSRLLLQGANRGIGLTVPKEPPLKEEDMKWVALAKAGRYFPLAAIGLKAGEEMVNGLERAGVMGGLFGSIWGAAKGSSQATLAEKITKNTSSEYLNALDITSRVLLRDPLASVLASRQRVIAIQVAGEVSKVYRQPVQFLEGLARTMERTVREYQQSEPTEKRMRFGAIVGVPAAGALLSATGLVVGLGLIPVGFLALTTIVIAPFLSVKAINTIFPDTATKVKEEEVKNWFAAHPEITAKYTEQEEEILKGLQVSGAIPTVAPEAPSAAMGGGNDLEVLKTEVLKQLTDQLNGAMKTRGQLQVQELLSLFLNTSYDIVDEEVRKTRHALTQSTLQRYLRDWVRLELYENWLKPKVQAAALQEFETMVAHYGSPEEYAAVALRPDLPLSLEAAKEQEEMSKNEALKKLNNSLKEVKGAVIEATFDLVQAATDRRGWKG